MLSPDDEKGQRYTCWTFEQTFRVWSRLRGNQDYGVDLGGQGAPCGPRLTLTSKACLSIRKEF